MTKQNKEREESLDHVNPVAEEISKLRQMEKETGKDFTVAISHLEEQLKKVLQGRPYKKNK